MMRSVSAARCSAPLGCAVSLLWLMLPASCARKETVPKPPDYNVILISVDTLRADRLNCYGYDAHRTSPNIDALARDGILFENHVAASPWTTPSHMSMLTSLYPTAHGITQPFDDLMSNMLNRGWFNKLPESRTTLADVLKAGGFETGAFTAGAAVDPQIGFGQGFTTYDTSMYKLGEANMGRMYEWIDRRASGRFFLFWHSFEVHAPYLQGELLSEVLPEESAAAIRNEMGQLLSELADPDTDVRRRIRSRRWQVGLLRRYNAFTREVCEALYLGCIRSMDRWMGRFLKHLRDRGLYDRTLIIFTSDHGEEFGDHLEDKIYGEHGHSLYEEMVRVPLIIKLPDQNHAGKRIADPVRSIDLMPTVLDVMGVAAANDEMQGASLRPLWEGRERDGDRIAVSESLSGWDEQKAVRMGRYKYIFSVDAETVRRHGRRHLPEQPVRVELYDLQTDPAERRNLLALPDGERFAELGATMERYLRQHVSKGTNEVEETELDQQTIEDLKALGYVK